MTELCAIWKTEVLENGKNNGVFQYNSPRAGGKYSITLTAKASVHSLTETQKAYLTTWLVDQHNAGNEWPTIDNEEIYRAIKGVPRTVQERRDRLLRTVDEHTPRLGALMDVSEEYNSWWLCAATESLHMNEVNKLIAFASAQGLLTSKFGLSLTFDGYSHVEKVQKDSSNSLQAFVAMWFNTEVAQAYDVGIEPAIRDAGYEAMRIDRKEHNNKIDDEIIAEIRRSRFLIADFTCGMVNDSNGGIAIPRGGVYYEAGFAQGLGIPVIWMCREDHIEHVHFDTRQFNHITWNDPAELRTKLRNRIGAVLGDAP